MHGSKGSLGRLSAPSMSRKGSGGKPVEMSRTNSSSRGVPLARTESSSSVNSNTAPTPAKPFKRTINVVKEYADLTSTPDYKPNLNLVVVGHVDAGKSTTMGHFLLLLGQVSSRMMQKYHQAANAQKKGSFAFAWVLDDTDSERERGVTIDVATREFEGRKKQVTLLDAPGHCDFIPNMISGAAQADAAILVVDASPGEFESGFTGGGQTREHALLLRSLGVGQIIVAVNKMDNVSWSRDRFDEINDRLRSFLVDEAGFGFDRIWFIPISGFLGENLTKPSTVAKLVHWYSGPCLLELIGWSKF